MKQIPYTLFKVSNWGSIIITIITNNNFFFVQSHSCAPRETCDWPCGLAVSFWIVYEGWQSKHIAGRNILERLWEIKNLTSLFKFLGHNNSVGGQNHTKFFIWWDIDSHVPCSCIPVTKATEVAPFICYPSIYWAEQLCEDTEPASWWKFQVRMFATDH